MIRAVVDPSVLLGVIREERSLSEFLLSDIEAVVSTVNLAEVVTKLILNGATEDEAWEDASRLADELVAFDPEQARIAGALVKRTKRYGLSLGDRACLALALTLDLPVYTADRVWKDVKAGVAIHIVR